MDEIAAEFELERIQMGLPPRNPDTYYTVGQLQAIVSEKDGKPCTSRNRPALLKKLGLPDVAKPMALEERVSMSAAKIVDGKVAEKRLPPLAPKERAKMIAKKPRAAKAPTTRQALAAQNKANFKASQDKRAKAHVKAVATAADRVERGYHAKALSYVRKAMARKSPPSLRALCEEMSKAKVQKPRGGTDWWPSSVQNLMRQAAKS